MPQFDGPFEITEVHPDSSNVTVFRPNNPDAYGKYHTSKLCAHTRGDPELHPLHENDEPGPVFAPDTGVDEHFVDRIIDAWRRGRGWQYLVRFRSYGPEHDKWKSGKELDNNEALDVWLAGNGGGGVV